MQQERFLGIRYWFTSNHIPFRFGWPREASRLEAKTHEAEARTHEAEAEAEATTHEAEAEAEARFFGLEAEARPRGLTSLSSTQIRHWGTSYNVTIKFNPTTWHCDVMTSQHDAPKLIFPISACRCARKMILFLFLWNFGLLSSKMLSVLYLHDDVTSWRHIMTSCHDVKNRLYCSQLVEVLERWFFFCFYSFPAFLVQKCYRFCVCMMSWRHDVTSWCHKTHFSYVTITSWRHVMTSWVDGNML